MKCSELLRLIKNAGWYEDRQSGSHIILKHPDKSQTIIFPNHGSKEMGKGLEEKIKKQKKKKKNKNKEQKDFILGKKTKKKNKKTTLKFIVEKTSTGYSAY